MTCPYCLRDIFRWDDAEWFGRHQVHTPCQRLHRDNGLPHLLPGGWMRWRTHTIDPEAANAMFSLFRRTKEEGK